MITLPADTLQDPSLSTSQKLDLIRRTVVDQLQTETDGARILAAVGIVLASWLVLRLLARAIRRHRSTSHWADLLSRWGLDGDEVRLFVRLARRVPLPHLPRLGFDAHCFDKSAHLLLRRLRDRTQRESQLFALLSLRHRLSFRIAAPTGTLDAGTKIHLERLGGKPGEGVFAQVVGTHARAVQLALLEPDPNVLIAEGARVRIRLRALGGESECRVKVLRRVSEVLPRLAIERPSKFIPTRPELRQSATRTPVRVELIERLPTRLNDDAAPVVEGVISRATTHGVFATIPRGRLKFGEAVRLVTDDVSATYVSYGDFSAARDAVEYFLLRGGPPYPVAKAAAAPTRAKARTAARA